MTTLAQYRTSISSKIGLDNSTTGDQTAVDLWVNEGVLDVLMRTSCQVRSATMTLTAGVENYIIDSAILRIIDIFETSSGGDNQLIRSTVDEINMLRRTTSTSYVSPAQYYALQGSDLLLLYPTPDLTGDTITVYYVPRPATLALSSDSPTEVPAEFHKAIEFYALGEAANMADDSTSQQGTFYLQQYEQWIKRIKKWIQMKQHHRMPRASVARGGSVTPYHDRSAYPSR